MTITPNDIAKVLAGNHKVCIVCEQPKPTKLDGIDWVMCCWDCWRGYSRDQQYELSGRWMNAVINGNVEPNKVMKAYLDDVEKTKHRARRTRRRR